MISSFGLGQVCFTAISQVFQESRGPARWESTDVAPGNDRRIGMNGIRRVGREHNVSRAHQHQHQMRQPFLGADGDDGLVFRIEIDVVAPLVPFGDRFAQPGDSARRGIAVVVRLSGRLDQLVDDVLGRRQVGVSHPQIDDVLPRPPLLHLERVHLGKNIWRQPVHSAPFGNVETH